MQPSTGILLVNLGTPLSPLPKDVYRYLNEFLTDEKVIDVPWLWRQILVRGLIVPFRYRQSARCYQTIWTKEGSPLLVYGKRVQKLLQEELGRTFHVELGMRYQQPSIEEGISRLMDAGIKEMVIVPLFPQYAEATTGSIHKKVMSTLGKHPPLSSVRFIKNFPTHPKMIEAFSQRGQKNILGKNYDHILFSFHGLPQKHIVKADKHNWCLQKKECCQHYQKENQSCYSAQCNATATAIAESLGLHRDTYSISFQSRLGKDPWLQPYTLETLKALVHAGKKRVLVYCPSFVCDCLETIYEIEHEYKQEFIKEGGENLDLVPGLNEHPLWIESLKSIIKEC